MADVPFLKLRAVLLWVCPKCHFTARAVAFEGKPKCPECKKNVEKEVGT